MAIINSTILTIVVAALSIAKRLGAGLRDLGDGCHQGLDKVWTHGPSREIRSQLPSGND